MCRVSRVTLSHLQHLIVHVVFITTTVHAQSYIPPIEIQLWDTGRSPLAYMVDVTNGFGLKVLAEHNFLNDNNIAFSPYGLTGIMVALFEGIDGESSYQVQQAMQLPWSRNVMRIGFRDIHRTLKTYFVPEEGFLAGLALNNENVTFNENYKTILRFYGFDLDRDQLPTTTTPSETTTITGADGNGTNTEGTTVKPAAETTTAQPKEPEVNPTTVNREMPNENTDSPTTVASASPMDTTVQIIERNPDTEPTTGANIQATTTEPNNQATTEPPKVSTMTENTTPELNVAPETQPPTTAVLVESTTVATDLDTTTVTVADTTSMVAQSDASTTNSNDVTTLRSDVELLPTTDGNIDQTTVTEDASTISNDIETSTTAAVENLERRKKSVIDFVYETPARVDDFLVMRSFDIPSQYEPNVNSEKVFLANGLRNVQVEYMEYDTILFHAYLPHLGASALRLPLDSDRYYLLIVLPDRVGIEDLSRMIARMARESDLRDVQDVMRPRRVRARVPSFTVKGHVALTTDLQKLGMRDVFEPRQRDFTPMTSQPGVYVRSIEQAVSVAIRKYSPDDQKNRYYASQPPVHFMATYPFVYFVMDSTIHVSLMAGKLVDPLNSRIL